MEKGGEDTKGQAPEHCLHPRGQGPGVTASTRDCTEAADDRRTARIKTKSKIGNLGRKSECPQENQQH